MSVRLAHIDLYPIKSFDPVAVEAARVLPAGGLEHDRQYAVFDKAGKLVNGKRTPLVHRLQSSFDDSFEQVTLTDREDGRTATFSFAADRPRLEAWLAERFGFPVDLREDKTSGFPDDTLSSGPTIIAAETLAHVGDWFGVPFDEARRRFRANLVVEGGGPFWDDRLFAEPGETVTFRIGEAMFFGTNPCARCVVPSRDSVTGEQRPGFAKEFAVRRRESLPAWSHTDAFDHFYRLAVNTRFFAPATGGRLRVGDDVEVFTG
ncbi:MAG: MOSC N-terminal beta barrel domain-containing protein [Planctomycetaceae bacterium]